MSKVMGNKKISRPGLAVHKKDEEFQQSKRTESPGLFGSV